MSRTDEIVRRMGEFITHGDAHLRIELFARLDSVAAFVGVAAKNAAEAMQARPQASRRITRSAACAADGAQLGIADADTGPGISPELRERLFAPCVSTKADGRGAGLSICRPIVEAHDGSLRADSNPGGGGVLSFTLPLLNREIEHGE